jgi:eukaryotic-like serine/threonine-protein kinase
VAPIAVTSRSCTGSPVARRHLVTTHGVDHNAILSSECSNCRFPMEPAAQFCGFCGAQLVLNNRYLIEGMIGEGGFSRVYRARQLATHRVVALKLPRAHDAEIYARFAREAIVLCQLRDAHTVVVYDFDRTPKGTPFIAMELLEGMTLRSLLRREGRLPWERVCRILHQICSSLAELHAHQVVHRDLKLDNVFVEQRCGLEHVKVLDFGICKPIPAVRTMNAEELTAVGSTIGTLEYMSPEQLMGVQLDARSDIYALGVIAYELLAGKLPFGSPPLEEDLIPERIGGDVPRMLERLIRRCLSRSPADRYADATTVALALEVIRTTAHSAAGSPVVTRPARFLPPSAMPTIPDQQPLPVRLVR